MLEDGRTFLTVHVPPPRLVVIGAVHISQALAPMARLAIVTSLTEWIPWSSHGMTTVLNCVR
jgi:hypothetical protein